MTTLLLTHPCFLEHDTGPGHPERPDRMRAIDKVLSHDLFKDLKREEAPLRDDVEDAIALAHPRAYIDWVKEQRPASGEAPVHLDPDTVLSPKSWEPALRAVGAGLVAVDRVMDKGSGIANVFCQVRPCGHHAEHERAMGFCIFNNIAVAGLYARQKYGAERIAVVDFDVHHGNGTQDIFWSDKNLYLGSTHQMPLYPGTGALSDGRILDALAGELDVTLGIPVFVGDDLNALRETARGNLALYTTFPFFQRLFRASGFAAEADEMEKGTGGAALSDRLLDAVCLLGPVERCQEQLAAFRSAGVDLPIFVPPIGVEGARALIKEFRR